MPFPTVCFEFGCMKLLKTCAIFLFCLMSADSLPERRKFVIYHEIKGVGFPISV